MLTRGINYINFKKKKSILKKKKKLRNIFKEKNEIIKSLGKFYKYSFQKKNLKKYKTKLNYKLLNGWFLFSVKAIYDFLNIK